MPWALLRLVKKYENQQVHVHNNLQKIKLPTGWTSTQSTYRYLKVHVLRGIQSNYKPIQGLNVTIDLTDS